MTTTERAKKAAPVTDAGTGEILDAEPFEEGEQTAVDLASREFLAGLEEWTTPDQVAEAKESADLGTSPVHITKDHLVGQPFVLRDAKVIVDGAIGSDGSDGKPPTRENLVIAAVQAVELANDGKVQRVGPVYTVTVGGESSVAGSQALLDLAANRNRGGILYRDGFTKHMAGNGLGEYYSLRPQVAPTQKMNLLERATKV